MQQRLQAIDKVRGLVMLIMAIDHVRDLFHATSLTQDPTDLATTTPLLFFTRWITHFCAPVFVFLAGTSAYLRQQSKPSRSFLITRGAWLLFLELTVINFGIWWDIHFNVFLFQVIGAIGIGFIVLGLLINVSSKWLGLLGVLIIILHGAYALIPFSANSSLQAILNPFFTITPISFATNKLFLVAYPVLPWFGIMLAGFGVGTYFTVEKFSAKKMYQFGLLLLALFIVLRLSNILLDPRQWQLQQQPLFTLLSFLNVSKYPPSLLFTLLTIGVMFLLLSICSNFKNKVGSVLQVYGRVPMFYYLLHWYIAHSLLFALLYVHGYSTSQFTFGFNFGRPQNFPGLPLHWVYILWACLVIAMYPLCKWFGSYKQNNKHKKWLSYL
jgi:uncharacterized membrane protein